MATPSAWNWRWRSPARPRLLLMDEPTAGMAHGCARLLMRLASELADRDGIAVLFTEHDMDVVFGFADRVIVLDRGRIIAERHARRDSRRSGVQAVYLGDRLAG